MLAYLLTIVPTRVSPPTRSVMVTRSPCIRLTGPKRVRVRTHLGVDIARGAEGDAVAVSEAHGTTGRGSARVGTRQDLIPKPKRDHADPRTFR